MRQDIRHHVDRSRRSEEEEEEDEEEEVDWGGDDEVDMAAAAAYLAQGGQTATELLQLLLAEQQKLQQKLSDFLGAGTGKSADVEVEEQAWEALRQKDSALAEKLLRTLPRAKLAAMKDTAGMTPLHLSARERWVPLTEFLVKAVPEMASERSFQRQPPNWTPLMSLANTPKARSAAADDEARVISLLLDNMPESAVNCQSGTGASCTHLAVAKGNTELAERVLQHLYTQGGWDATSTHLALANSSGKSAVDVAFRSQSAYAARLVRYWWGPSYTPAPAQDERGYAYRARR